MKEGNNNNNSNALRILNVLRSFVPEYANMHHKCSAYFVVKGEANLSWGWKLLRRPTYIQPYESIWMFLDAENCRASMDLKSKFLVHSFLLMFSMCFIRARQTK